MRLKSTKRRKEPPQNQNEMQQKLTITVQQLFHIS
jgi:hypothetical protein